MLWYRNCIIWNVYCLCCLNSWTSSVNTLIHTNCFTCRRFFALGCGWQRAGITLTFYNTLKFHTWQLIYTEMRENVCLCVWERRRTCMHICTSVTADWPHRRCREHQTDRHGREVKDTEQANHWKYKTLEWEVRVTLFLFSIQFDLSLWIFLHEILVYLSVTAGLFAISQCIFSVACIIIRKSFRCVSCQRPV